MSYHKILELMKDTPQYSQRRKVISANSNNEYVVSIRKRDNRWACSCKGWIFVCQKREKDSPGSDCQHIEEIRRIYGNKVTANSIVVAVTEFVANLEANKIADAMGMWCSIKDGISMLLFYYENTPKESDQVEPTRQLIKKAETLVAIKSGLI